MSEIEKLYENVKVYDFRYDCDVSFTDGQFGRITSCSKGEVKDYCTDKKYFKSAKVINYKRLYPPFTAEKQLELIKWLSNKKLCISSPQAVNTYVDKFWHIGINPFNFKLDMVNDLTFEECLSGLVNYLWEYLTKEEKEQIRGILNG